MALSQANIDALEKALTSGTLRVDFPDGGSVTYKSNAELLAALSYARSQITPDSYLTRTLASFDRD